MIMLLFVVYSMGPGQTTCMLHYYNSLWASSGLPHGIGPRVSGSQSATNSCRQRDRESARERERAKLRSNPLHVHAWRLLLAAAYVLLLFRLGQLPSSSTTWGLQEACPMSCRGQTPDYVFARPNCCLPIIRKSFFDLSKIQQECTGVQRGENVSGACLHSLTRCTTSDLECLMFWHFHLTDSLR